MKALVYDGPHRMHVEELPDPTPGDGEVRIRVGACGICGSDVHGYTGESGRRTPGQVMGHEFAGRIDRLGPGVTEWSVGQRVAVYNMFGCGKCSFCLAGQEQCCPGKRLIGVNTGTRGAFAEYVCVAGSNLTPIADDLPYAIALLNEPLSVALHALKLVPEEAESLAIVGGGTIGQCLVRVARVLWSAGKDLYVLEPLEQKRRLLEASGAVAIDSSIDALHQFLPEGADAAIEAVGMEATVQLALQAIRPGGTLVLLGNLAKEVRLPLQHISSTEKRLAGSYGFNRADFDAIIDWMNHGRFDLSSLLTATCVLEDAPLIFEELASGKRQAVKIVVEP